MKLKLNLAETSHCSMFRGKRKCLILQDRTLAACFTSLSWKQRLMKTFLLPLRTSAWLWLYVVKSANTNSTECKKVRKSCAVRNNGMKTISIWSLNWQKTHEMTKYIASPSLHKWCEMKKWGVSRNKVHYLTIHAGITQKWQWGERRRATQLTCRAAWNEQKSKGRKRGRRELKTVCNKQTERSRSETTYK